MAILNNSNAITTSGGYDINNSLRFRRSATAYLSRTPASAGTQTTWTWSGWVKRSILGSQQKILTAGSTGSLFSSFEFIAGDNFQFYAYNGATNAYLVTTQVFRDPSAWYHIVFAVDTTQATSTNRIKIYVNGTQVTAFSTATYPSQNFTFPINNNVIHNIGRDNVNAGDYFDGYMADFNFVDGQALTPSSFGETDTTTGSWKPKAYTGTYGTNGFYLKFSDIATTSGSNAGLGKDFSGNGNYWTTNNISVTSGTTYDAMTDSPTLTSATVANYCVMNPLNKLSAATTSNGNLNVQTSGSSGATINGTFGVSSGKWYWETILNAATDATIFGIDEITELPSYPGVSSTSYSYYPVSALKINNAVQTSYGVTATTNDVIGCALDMDNGKIWWSKNGTWMASGDPVAGTNAAFTGITGTKTPAVGDGSSGSNVNVEYNFGQRPFSYTPPTGYLALNTFNLPNPTILQGNKYMDATLYTGTGTALNVVNAGQFKPDFVWAKNRSAADSSGLYDSVRGVNQRLISNLTNAEDTSSGVSAFNSNGFSLGTAANYNTNGNNFVGWSWQAGQGSTSSNTSGSITSTVSVNTTAGFSIVTYTGTGANATVGHGLGVAPKMIIFKQRNAVRGWIVYHASLANASTVIYLNVTNAANTDATAFNATAPTSSVFSVGTSADTNQSTGTYVAYCWAEIAGFSKFGSYTGNGSADGPFVATNFKPKFVMIKVTSTTNVWLLIDATRNPYNVANLNLNANDSAAENTASTGAWLDFTSNGFKIRNGSDSAINSNGATYVYACFASHPFKSSLAR